ncbi:hypothetical protein LUZ60_007423 [Juncus effusus]|nr:hypothetical protein LUZ60_007423 [Juncus effusus]
MFSPGLNLVMTVIGFAVSTMFIVFVCTRLICARIHLRNSRAAFASASGSNLSTVERGLNGLEPVVVSSFPTNKFEEFPHSEQDTQCTVCLAEYQQKDILRVMPNCGHSFHVTCIDTWLKQNYTCPICRISLRDSVDKKHVLPLLPPFCYDLPHQQTSGSDRADQIVEIELERKSVESPSYS